VANDEKKPRDLNKQLLAEELAERMGLARSVAAEAVENVFDIMAWTVAQGFTVSITNCLSMERVSKKSRMARNPHNGDRIEVPARKAIRVNVSPRLNQFANSDHPEQTTIRKQAKGPARNKNVAEMNDGTPVDSAVREGLASHAR
jgi:nucleoid DNA-binding protein